MSSPVVYTKFHQTFAVQCMRIPHPLVDAVHVKQHVEVSERLGPLAAQQVHGSAQQERLGAVRALLPGQLLRAQRHHRLVLARKQV
jgi:hypothetical protein